MRTRTIKFEEVKAIAKRTGVCQVCGRKATRTYTFTEYISPFHSAITSGMSPSEARTAVRNSVAAKAAVWAPDSSYFTHQKCSEPAGGAA